MSICKYSVMIAGHRTSISLEPEFWDELKRLARENGETLRSLIARVDAVRQGNLSSALRVFVLRELKK